MLIFVNFGSFSPNAIISVDTEMTAFGPMELARYSQEARRVKGHQQGRELA
jgi:hypothetical protein